MLGGLEFGTFNGINQYTEALGTGAAAYLYDDNGNLRTDGSSSFLYDAENRMVSATGARNATLSYDPLGRLWQVTGTGGTTRFLYDGDRLVMELNGSGAVQRAYVHGPGADEPMVAYGPEGRRFLHTDHQGSIIAANDDSGNAVFVNSYDPWGVPGANNQGRFQYTGQAWIPELGMYYYKARIYWPTIGRFLQTDPIGYADQANLYAYVGNDPVDGTDPTGEQCEPRPRGGQSCTIIPEQKTNVVAAAGIAVVGGVAAVWNAGVHLYERVTGRNQAVSPATATSQSKTRREDGYVVRVQAQGTGLRNENSIVIAQKTPVTASQVRAALGAVTAPLTRREQAIMAPGVVAANRYVNQAAAAGGVPAGVPRSFEAGNGTNMRQYRIDVETLAGNPNIVPD